MSKKTKIRYDDIDAINARSSPDWFAGEECVVAMVTEKMIAQFANVTNNHQWIHKPHPYSPGDPYPEQIAQGLLLLSLIPGGLNDDGFEIVGHKVRVIRGFERVRFTYPVRPNATVLLSSRNLKAYPAPSGKGTIVEREIQLWTDNIVWPETVLVCTLKMQYF